MIYEIPKIEILNLVKRQLSCYFSLDKSEELALEQVFPLVLEKCNINFSRNPSRYYH